MLKLLLSDIEKQKGKFKILTVVFDDGSVVPNDLSSYDVKYIKYYINHGKKRYWQLINDVFKYCKNIDSKYYIFLPDDIRLRLNFFENAIKHFEIIKEEKKLLNLLIDKQRGSKPQWIKFVPKAVGRLIQTQWTDMCFICNKSVFEALNYEIEPILVTRWNNNPYLSSGVGRQITMRLNKLSFKIFHVKKTLVIHDDHISVMNPNERKLNPLTT